MSSYRHSSQSVSEKNSECQIVLDFPAARDDGGGGGDV